MPKNQITHNIDNIEFKVLYSGRRTLGISILPDSSVVVRVPNLTSLKTISRIVQEKAGWIKKHRDSYKNKEPVKNVRLYVNGEVHLFRGKESVLKIEKSGKPYTRFHDSTIEIGLQTTNDTIALKRLLYQGYKKEAMILFPEMLSKILANYEDQIFRPSGLVVRTMKRRWGSCSNRGKITLSTELIKLSDRLIEYVILHELCHLKHHNHGNGYYKLLSELLPDWKSMRKELRTYIRL